MLQTLFHIPKQIGGVPLFGLGLLLAVWAIVSGLLLWRAVRRQGWNAETWGYVPLLALVAAIIIWLLPALSKDAGVPIRGYGVMMLVAVLAGVGLGVWRARRLGIDADTIFSLAFWVFVPGIVGARLFYVIEYWGTEFRPLFNVSPGKGIWAVANVTEGGLVVFGSLIGGMVGLAAFCFSRRLPALAVCDLIAPSLALGQAIGRIGCLLNGCCFGGLCDDPWAVTFPRETPPYERQIDRGQLFGVAIGGPAKGPPVVEWVAPDSPWAAAGVVPGDRLTAVEGEPIDFPWQARAAFHHLYQEPHRATFQVEGRGPVVLPPLDPPPRSLPVHPTQIYSAIDAFVLCLLLLAIDPFLRRDGQLFAIGLTLHAVSRFLLEIIRIDESPVFGTGLSISQNISLLLLAAALGMWLYGLRRPPGRAFGQRTV